MLTLLKIRNLALVDELEWELGAGLIGVTGETGAGKSVIVGALKLILGERAEKSLIRSGEETCSVEAVFELRDAAEVNAVLADGGLDACDDTQLIIRRVIGQTANRQFINDSPVTLALLKRLGEHLVDLHGPHDHQSQKSKCAVRPPQAGHRHIQSHPDQSTRHRTRHFLGSGNAYDSAHECCFICDGKPKPNAP